ncbi:MAG: hypothetical protein LUQ65_02580 [Candidatus Helarchaeota archaeon]|nr:hypothetical protein [Candidatus Helarchaeota archaeon]
MKKQSEHSRLNLRAGDIVEVRSFDEIASTLGDDGTMAGLPFQPEMRKYCGGKYRVLRPIKKLIIENANTGLRGIRNTVLLDSINCDGQQHHDCTRYCFFLWREAWLKRASHHQHPANPPADLINPTLQSLSQALPSLSSHCQSMELVKATYPLQIWNLKQYIWDITDNTLPLLRRITFILVSCARHIKKFLGVRLPKRFNSHLDKTPSVDFSLQPGDLVVIKNLDEITATLDSSGRNRGLAFTKEMKKFCGHIFSVLKPVDQIIVEGTGEMRKLSHTVILDGANCDGQPHFGCGRNCYLMWRKIWLEKI